MMHHHGADGECHPGPGGLLGCRICEADSEDETAEESPAPCALCQGYCTNGAECAVAQFVGKRIDWRPAPVIVLGERE